MFKKLLMRDWLATSWVAFAPSTEKEDVERGR